MKLPSQLYKFIYRFNIYIRKMLKQEAYINTFDNDPFEGAKNVKTK